MKTRTYFKLLKLIRTHTKTEKLYEGLCGTIGEMENRGKITFLECQKLRLYFENNAPNKLYKSSLYWWKCGDKNPRLKWLEKHINKLNKS